MAEEKEANFCQMLNKTVVEWQIKDFINPHSCKTMLSPAFWVSSSRYQIQLAPEENDDSDKSVSLYLYRLKGKEPLLISVTFSIKVSDSVIKSQRSNATYSERNIGWGYRSFLNLSELSKILTTASSNGTFTVVCTIHIPDIIQEGDVSISTQTQGLDNSVEILTKNLEDIFLSHKLSDVNIKVGSRNYLAHKTVLAARSPVFSSMFEHEMTENLSGTVDITDCDSDCFELFLRFLYTGNVDKTTNSNSLELYKIADKYCINDLKERCCVWMLESLEVDSVCDVLEFATAYQETELLKTAIQFFTVNATGIFCTEKWQKFILEKPIMTSEILKQMAASALISLKPKQ